MKKVQFEKINVLLVDQKENKTEVVINNFKHVLEDNKLYEVQNELPARIANQIMNQYTKNEEGKYSDEDIEAIQKEFDEELMKLPKIEVQVFVWNENVIERVNNLINL